MHLFVTIEPDKDVARRKYIMKTVIKKLSIAALITTIFIFLTGCQSKEEQKTAARPAKPVSLTESVVNVEHTDAQDSIAEEDAEHGLADSIDKGEEQPAPQEIEGFYFNYNEEVFIPFSDCVCEYDNGDLQIYTKYFEEKNKYLSDGYTIIYMQTPDDNRQIVASDEYCIDYENGEVYYVGRDKYDDFISIYKYFAYSYDDGHWEVGGAKILNVDIVEVWLSETFGLALRDIEDSFSNIRVFVTALEHEHGIPILKGEASGVHIDTDEYCHVDWEINTLTETGEATPHEKKFMTRKKIRKFLRHAIKHSRKKTGVTGLNFPT